MTKSKHNRRALISLVAVVAILASVICLSFPSVSASEIPLDADGDGQALQVTVPAGSASTGSATKEVTGLDPEKTYEVTVWLKNTGGMAGATVWVDLYSDGTKISGASKNTGDLLKSAVPEWTKCVMTGITGADSVKIGFWGNNGTGAKDVNVYIDGLSIAEKGKVITVGYSEWPTVTAKNGTIFTAETVEEAEDDQNGDGVKHVISATGIGVKDEYNKSIWVQNLDASKSYTISLWYKSTGWDNANLSVKAYDWRAAGAGNSTFDYRPDLKAAKSEWTELKMTGVKAGTDTGKNPVQVNIGFGLWMRTKADTANYSIEIDNFTLTEETEQTPIALSNFVKANIAAIVELVATTTTTEATTTTTEATTTTTTTVNGAGETTTTTTTAPAGPDPVVDADGDNMALKVNIEAGKASLASGEYTVEGLDPSKTYKVTLYLENDGGIRNGNFWVNYDNGGKKNTTTELQGSLDEWTKCVLEGITNTTSVKMGLWLSNSDEGAVAASVYLDGVVIEEVGGTWKETVDLAKFTKATLDAEIVAFANETLPSATQTPDSAKYSYIIDVPNWALAGATFANTKNAALKSGGKVSDTHVYLDASGEGEQNTVQVILDMQNDFEVKNGVYDVSFWIQMSDLANGNFYVVPDGQDVDGRRVKITLKDAVEDWTQITLEGARVENGELKIGFWGRGGGNQYVRIDGVQVKLRGTGYVASEEVYGEIIDVKNTAFNLGSYGMLNSNGKVSSTKILVTGAEDFKNDAVYFAEGLEAGTYTVTAWVRSSGYHGKANLYANPDSTTKDKERRATFTGLAIDEWTQIEITGVEVDQSGELKIGMWVNSYGGGWVEFDGVQIKRVIGSVSSGDNGLTVPVALIVLSALTLGVVSTVLVARKRTAC